MRKETLLRAFNGHLRVIKEELSDGSYVFNIEIGEYEIPCVNELAALEAFRKMLKAERIAWGEEK